MSRQSGDSPQSPEIEWIRVWPEVQTVEIVPKYLLNGEIYQFVDGVLGLDVKALYKLYARQAADWAHIRDLDTKMQIAMSLVALLATTEHLTALTIRKELVVAGALSEQEEMQTLDVLLSSPLHKHSKSPQLWQHRRWLVQQRNVEIQLPREMQVIERAALHHPKNYYAWAYARSLPYSDLKDWVWGLARQNVSDTSIWSFLAVVCPEKTDEATALNERYRHEAIEAYLAAAPR